MFGNLGNVEVAELDPSIVADKYIRAFDISVDNLFLMEVAQPVDEVSYNVPDLVFFNKGLQILGLADL